MSCIHLWGRECPFDDYQGPDIRFLRNVLDWMFLKYLKNLFMKSNTTMMMMISERGNRTGSEG
jgi:hypothetical protein